MRLARQTSTNSAQERNKTMTSADIPVLFLSLAEERNVVIKSPQKHIEIIPKQQHHAIDARSREVTQIMTLVRSTVVRSVVRTTGQQCAQHKQHRETCGKVPGRCAPGECVAQCAGLVRPAAGPPRPRCHAQTGGHGVAVDATSTN